MNADQMLILLRLRRELTGESFNDATVEAWGEALRAWDASDVRGSIVAAAREHARVTIAHLYEQLPSRTHNPALAAPHHCELCDGTGWLEADPERSGPAGHAVDPCRCSRGAELAKRYGLTPQPPALIGGELF